MNFDDISENLPSQFFEDQGVALTDNMCAIFRHDNQNVLGLFIRDSGVLTAPMAVTRSGMVLLIVDCKTKGLFEKTVYLILRSKEGDKTSLTVPLNSLAREYSDTAPKFFSWLRSILPSLAPTSFPDFMYARNIKLE